MKRHINKVLLLTALLMTFSQACTDLEEELYSAVTEENFYQTEDDFASALGVAYTSLYPIMDNYFALQEVTTDEMVVPQRGQDWFDNGAWIRLHKQTYTFEDPAIAGGWTYCFQGINACNRLIETFEEAGEQVEGADKLISELKVLRGLYYYWLLDLYGNVPIVDRFTVEADFAPTNNTRQEVFDFVESEVMENMGSLDTELSLGNYGRMTQWSAHAILAKLYLNAEIYTGTPRWQDAVAQCDAIINSGKYSIEENYFDNFDVDNENSLENILAIPFDPKFAGGMNVHMRSLHYANQQTYNLTEQPWNGFCSLQEFYESYEDTDVRKQNFLVGQQYSAAGEPLVDPGANNAPIIFTPEINEIAPNARRDAGVRIGKFEIENGATSALDNDYPIFRYGDILLMKAEALFRQGQTAGEALTLVNQIRERADASVAPLTELTEETLLAERGREMFAECYRRQDMIRFGKYASGTWFEKDPRPDYVRIFPIPRDQLNSNANLNQNPGYEGGGE